MHKIDYTTLLPVGTRVMVHNKYGTVVSAEMTHGIPCGMIAFHMIKYDSKRVFIRDPQTGQHAYTTEPIKEYTQGCNPSFIQVV